MLDLSCIYYTSNREDDIFEQKIRNNILAQCNGVPIISVSQKLIEFGKNICVGDIGVSDENCRKQLLIGCEEAKTKYVCVAESDFLYSKEYFKFIPHKRLACARHIYVVWVHKNGFYRKWLSEGAITAEREYLIKLLDNNIPLRASIEQRWNNGIPLITFKTHSGMSQKADRVVKHSKTSELPFWGSIFNLKREFLCHQE